MSAKKVSHADYVARVEAILRDAGRPFVVVDDAKKAIFAGGQVGNFDLLIYMVEGDHLLATVLPKSRPEPTVEQQAELRQWARVFGAGFVAAFIHATDEPTAWRLDQEPRQPRPLRSVLAAGWDAPVPPAGEPPPALILPPDDVEVAVLEHLSDTNARFQELEAALEDAETGPAANPAKAKDLMREIDGLVDSELASRGYGPRPPMTVPAATPPAPLEVAESDERRRAASLGYLFPGAQPAHRAELQPMLF